MPPAAIAALQSHQDGLVTLAQALDAGLSPRAVQRRVRDGGWVRVAPRVYRGAGHPVTDRGRVRAAGLWVGGRGAVSGPAAAYWHGMAPRAPAEVEVTVPRAAGLRGFAGVRVRRRDLADVDVATVGGPADGRGGIRVTAAALTALECAAVLPDGAAFLDRALQRHVRFAALHRAYSRHLGAHGAARAGALLVAAADRADSGAERLLISLLRRAGVTGWARGLPFGAWEIDVAFPEVKLAVEVDGWAWHVDVARFRADRRKGNALVAAGWVLLRFTWHDLVERPGYVVAEIRSALRRAA